MAENASYIGATAAAYGRREYGIWYELKRLLLVFDGL